jgi:tetratricopeptide (TPR) repeat protein
MEGLDSAPFDQHGDGEGVMKLSLFSDSTQHPWRNYSNLGLLHRQMAQPDLAIFWFEKALEMEPSSQVVRVALAQTLESMGRPADAIYHLKYVAELQGRDVQSWLVDSLKRLMPPERDESEAESLPSSQPVVSSRTQKSKPSSSSSQRKPVPTRRLTMVDKIATGTPCCTHLRLFFAPTLMQPTKSV